MTEIHIAKHVSEASGHWYDHQGNQIDGVPYAASNKAKAGQLRPPTIRDARANGWGPGVTTITGCAAAPGLERWKIKQAILASLTLPRVDGETDDAWIARILEDSQEHAKQAAEEGTRIHAAIQCNFSGEDYNPTYEPHVMGADSAIYNLGDCSPTDWKAEVSCSSTLGYGTKADLAGKASGQLWIVDWKGKATPIDMNAAMESLQREDLYDNHYQQLAATRQAMASRYDLAWLDARCAIGFVSRDCPGAVFLREADEHDMLRGWHCFRALLDYWQAKNDYRPNWS